LLSPARIIVAGALLGGGLILLLVLPGTFQPPTVQLPLEMPGMRPHLLNVWVTPDPVTTGDAEITAQVVDRGGNPVMASAITFKLLDSSGDTEADAEGVPFPRTNRTDAGRFRAVLRVSGAGEWWELAVAMSGRRVAARFRVNIEP
jgi:hypothetical protein